MGALRQPVSGRPRPEVRPPQAFALHEARAPVRAAAVAADGVELWTARPQAGPTAAAPAFAAPAPQGVERRLHRRAERLWQELRAEAALPPADAARAMLTPPFGALAMLVAQTPRGARVVHAGNELAALGVVPGRIAPGARMATAADPVPARLAGLALAAIAAAAPQTIDSDDDPDLGGAPGLLFRGVALPFAPASGERGRAVVVTSWRTLLSAAETAALHHELRAAMAWLGGARAAPDRP